MEETTTEVVKKKARKSPNFRQQKAAELIAHAITTGSKITKGALLVKAGYSIASSKMPSNVIETPSFIAQLEKLGLTREKVVPMLVADLESKVGHRALELNIAGRWLKLDSNDYNTATNNGIQNSVIVLNITQPKEEKSIEAERE